MKYINMTDKKPERSEGDINLTNGRTSWVKNNINSKTAELLEEDAKYFMHQSLSTPCLNVLQSCKGSNITDIEGRDYLDFHGNNVHQAGYAHPAVIDAVTRQLNELAFCPRRYTNIPAIQLAKKLTKLAPGDLSRVLFAPGGTSAIGIALKIARIKTGRFKTISWWDSFHGASLDAISIGGEALFRSNIGPLLPGAVHVPPPSLYNSILGEGEEAIRRNLDYIEYVFEKEQDIAAFIAEPIRYSAVIMPPVWYWQRIRELCDKYGTLLIFDEIPICLGRTGYMFASEYYGIVPDILCIGKGLGGGVFPMAAVIAKENLNIAGDRALGHYTHEKSPVGAAAALAVIKVIEEENLLQRTTEKGKYFLDQLNNLEDKYEIIGDVRGIGLALAIELNNIDNKKTPAVDQADLIMYKCLEKGLSFKISMGNILSLMPPLTVSIEEIARAVNILEESIMECV
jgi:4-aminobutyrate aminotransferase